MMKVGWHIFVVGGLLFVVSSPAFSETGAWSTDFRYLAVDRTLHTHLENALLWMESAKPIKKILEVDQEWEKQAGFACPTPTSIFRDPQGRYRMYYSLMKENAKRWCAVAFSEDGLTWIKPTLGLAPGKFVQQDNNLIDIKDTDWIRGPYVFFDPGAPPEERYKMSWRMSEKMVAAVSPDGLRFRNVGLISDEGNLDSTNQAFLDPLTGQYTAYCRWWYGKHDANGERLPNGFKMQQNPTIRRGVSLKRSAVWSCDWPGKRTPIIDPAILFGDGGWTDLYNPCVLVYRGQYVAFPTLYIRYPLPDYTNTAGPLYPGFMYSRDGERWDCPGVKHPLIDLTMHTGTEYDIGMAFAAPALLERDDQLLIYYKYDPGKHHIPWEERMQGSAIYVASLRKDGFGAIGSRPKKVGYWLTLSIKVPSNSKALCINGIADGHIRVEIRNNQNQTIRGFLLDQSVQIKGDSLAQKAHWKAGRLHDLAGQEVRLYFELDNAKLYSFWFE
ncbi:MAG: hypothetical protein JXM79_12855 [Sedimentisphaerales bacterium]|nr:hypothetical protein [Sedimentisphaerales bacterium]